jgi:hypothetical protein
MFVTVRRAVSMVETWPSRKNRMYFPSGLGRTYRSSARSTTLVRSPVVTSTSEMVDAPNLPQLRSSAAPPQLTTYARLRCFSGTTVS